VNYSHQTVKTESTVTEDESSWITFVAVSNSPSVLLNNDRTSG
jgi:hypothetical protein